jgi:hypothetical protein
MHFGRWPHVVSHRNRTLNGGINIVRHSEGWTEKRVPKFQTMYGNESFTSSRPTRGRMTQAGLVLLKTIRPWAVADEATPNRSFHHQENKRHACEHGKSSDSVDSCSGLGFRIAPWRKRPNLV